jgi:hypothetical protein
MRGRLLFLVFGVAMLFGQCASLRELQLPSLPEERFINDQVNIHASRKSPFGCFGYRSFYDSLIKRSFIDSTLTFGIVIPWSSFFI